MTRADKLVLPIFSALLVGCASTSLRPACLLLLIPRCREVSFVLLRTLTTYACILASPASPAKVLDWLYRGTREPRVRLLFRDILCNTEVARTELRCPAGHSTDPQTHLSRPSFNFLFTLEDKCEWAPRRRAIVVRTPAMVARARRLPEPFRPPPGRADLYTRVLDYTFRMAFWVLFGREMTEAEHDSLYPGIADINQNAKRQRSRADVPARRACHEAMRALVARSHGDERFLFHGCAEFHALSEDAQIDVCGADILQSITVQTSDLLCHLLLMWREHGERFSADLEASLQETLRLYPLSDCFYHYQEQGEAWIAPLVLLNRNGWDDPDDFKPERFRAGKDRRKHLSYSGGPRVCPSFRVTEEIALATLRHLDGCGFWFQPAANFEHERTFSFGLPAQLGYAQAPGSAPRPPLAPPDFRFPRRRAVLKRHYHCFVRMLAQREVW